ncbi:MAG: tetratricopeptide repeat protein, partial [Ilumatobacteraceae bacterium]
LAVGAADVDRLALDPAARDIVLEIVRATGGWPLAVQLAAQAVRRTGPIDGRALVDVLLAPDAVLFDYLAEEILAGASPDERELLGLVAHLPHVSAGLLAELGRGDLAPSLEPIGGAGIFLEAQPTSAGAYRATLLGGEFLRRALPRPPAETLRRSVDVLARRGDIEHALVLCTTLDDPVLATEVVLSVERPDRMPSPDALVGALALAERAGPHPGIAELRGDLQYMRGEWDDALTSYARAAALGDPHLPRLVRKRAVILYLRGRLDEAESTCDDARIDGSDPAEESQVLAWRAAMRWIRGDVDGCERLLAPAEAAAHASGDDAALATVHTTRAMLAALHGDRRANAHSYQQALVHAERAGDVVQIVRVRANRGSHHIEEGDYPEAIADLSSAIEIAELVGSETFSALAYANRGDAYMQMGRLDDSLRDLRRAQGIWERLGSDMVDYALGQLGHVQALRGQRSEALALYRQAIELAERRGDVQALVPALIGQARVLAADDPDRAAELAERAIAGSQSIWQPHALLAAGWIELQRGDRSGAGRRAADALALAHAYHDRPAAAEALLLQATLAQPPSTVIAEEAGRLWRDLGNPVGEARAAMLLATTRSGRARDELLATAEQLLFDAGAWGYLADARRAAAATTPDSSPIVVATLGGFRVTRRGTAIELGDWGSKKARDLVKLLVARRGAPVVRDEAAAMLWPDEPDRSARRLSVLLSTIRSVLDPAKADPPDHYVAADHGTAWLVREHVEVDVELFLREAAEGRRLLTNGDEDKAAAVLTRAVGRYLGEFLAEDPYADWAAGMRELARHTFVEAAGHLGRLADARGEHGEAVRYRLRILDVDPYDEAAHLDLIRALTAQRRHGEARRAYRTYCDRLEELDLDPAGFP